jgi:hypothetical protein
MLSIIMLTIAAPTTPTFPTPPPDQQRHACIDITGLDQHKRGQRVINALLASSAEMFRTKRGRLALVIKLETFEKLREQLKIETTDSFDGTLSVIFPAPSVAVAAVTAAPA